MRYVDFDLLITSSEQGFEAHVVSSPAGEATHTFEAPFEPLHLENLLLRLGRSPTRRRGFSTEGTRAAKELGKGLFNAVFAGDVGACLHRSLLDAESEGNGLRIRLRIKAPGLAEIPWEYLYDASLNQFLALSRSTSVVRYLELARHPWPLHVTRPLTILVVISSPRDYDELNTEQEWRKLNDALSRLPKGAVRIERVDPTLSALQGRLRQGPVHILHFIGHGAFDDRVQDGLILLENENHNAVEVGSEKLAAILHNHPSLRLVVLNCCEGARSSAKDPFSGVATALVQKGLPAVVAMQFEIADTAAITFAQNFYQSIADGLTIDNAIVEARTSMFVTDDEESFGAPVLYMRSGSGILFDIDTTVAEEPEPPAPRPPVETREPEPSREPLSNVSRHALETAVQRNTKGVTFGLLWLAVNVATIALVRTYAQPLDFESLASALAWSHIGLCLALAQSLVMILPNRWRSVSAWPEVVRWVVWCTLATGIAAAGTVWMASLGFAAMGERAGEFLCAVGYSIAQAFALRRRLQQVAPIIIVGLIAGMALSRLSIPFLIGVMLLLVLQGYLLRNAAFRPPSETDLFRGGVTRYVIAAVLMLLIQLTVIGEAISTPAVPATTQTTTEPSNYRGPSAEEVMTLGSIEGKVTHANGEPVTGARVEGIEPYVAFSQTDGYYSLGLVRQGKQDIRVIFPDNTETTVRGVTVTPGKTSVANLSIGASSDWDGTLQKLLPNSFREIELPLSAAGIVKGQAFKATGVPLFGAEAFIQDDHAASLGWDVLTMNQSAAFSVQEGFGDYTVRFSCDAYGDVYVEHVKVLPGKASIVEVVLTPGTMVQRSPWTVNVQELPSN